jgi:hypothetical protein
MSPIKEFEMKYEIVLWKEFILKHNDEYQRFLEGEYADWLANSIGTSMLENR